MREFSDSKGKVWRISITIGSVMRVKSKLGIDLLQIEKGDTPLITRLWEDELLMAEILACLMGEQLGDKPDTEIYEGFDGQTILKATTCFYDELIDFFQKSTRTDRAGIVEKQRDLISKVIAAATGEVNKLDVDKTISGIQFGSVPDKLE